MYFHLIWIKEKNWKQYEIDILLQWWEENLIRDFLAHWWIVVISLIQFKDEPTSFGNISMLVAHNNVAIQILMPWKDLSERLYYMIFLWLVPYNANYIDNPISESDMQNLLDSTFEQIRQENEKIKREKEKEFENEQKKYEEAGIKDALDIINKNIDRIEQVLKVWEWVISWTESRDLENCVNEMKKIRLWTNFNKMANLVLESHVLVKKAEEKILNTYKDQWFLISENTSITNIDLISQLFYYNRVSEKGKFDSKMLSTTEKISNFLWPSSVYLSLLRRDFVYVLANTSFWGFLDILLKLSEFTVLVATVILCVLWIIGPLIWIDSFSPYFLPAFWWLGLLLYLLSSLNLKSNIAKVIWFIILLILYWFWLKLLLSTFSL